MTHIDSRPAQDGVAEYSFEVIVADERVPAAIWAPSEQAGARPLVLMGHGATQHKKTASLEARARRYARKFGYATLAIDALGHGERFVGEDPGELVDDVVARVTGAPRASAGPSPIFKTMRERIRRIAPEWKAALDVAQTLEFIGPDQPVGYWGISMGTVLGVPLVAAEPRITCAVFGLAGLRSNDEAALEAARGINVPVEFTFQWDDPIATRETGISLFNAFGGKEKSMHINPGGHGEIPAHEELSWESFFRRHLGERAGAF